MDGREQLIERSIPFLDEVKNMTAGPEVERWLNETYGPGSALYEDLSRLIKQGVEEGWAANIEVGGRRYRRGRLCDPTERTLNFSITAVYMDSQDGRMVIDDHDEEPGNAESSFRGDYHGHPYGELNMVVPLDETAVLAGPSGWCHAGWTAPGPGSHHYPEVKGGALIALFFLPAGRISYDVRPPVEAATRPVQP
jgi:hypothetical protein